MKLYTGEQRNEVLTDLGIAPVIVSKRNSLVTAVEAAAILTWRARNEYGVEHLYSIAAIHRLVERGNLPVGYQKSERIRYYRVEDVFALALTPRRGLKRSTM